MLFLFQDSNISKGLVFGTDSRSVLYLQVFENLLVLGAAFSPTWDKYCFSTRKDNSTSWLILLTYVYLKTKLNVSRIYGFNKKYFTGFQFQDQGQLLHNTTLLLADIIRQSRCKSVTRETSQGKKRKASL